LLNSVFNTDLGVSQGAKASIQYRLYGAAWRKYSLLKAVFNTAFIVVDGGKAQLI